LYVFLITPGWWVSSGYGAYTIAKIIGAAAICTVVVPTYLMARPVLDRRLALIPCGLVVAGTWMVAAGGILTENVAFPLAVFASWAAVEAVRRPGTRWVWIAFACALVAAWSRYQMIILVPAIVGALLLDVVRAGDRRARLQMRRVPLALAAVASVAWAAVFLADPELIGGSYVGVGHFHPPITSVVSDVWEHSLALVLMVGIVPAIAVLGAAMRRSNWTDEGLGPLLCVVIPLAALLLVESSYFTAGYGVDWAIDRYVEYAAPITLVLFCAVVVRRAVAWRAALVVSTVAAIGLWFTPSVLSATEQRALYGLSSRMHSVLGTGATVSVGVLGTVVILAALAIACRAPRHAATVLVLLSAVLVITESEAAWKWQTRLANHWSDQYPADKSWVDDHAGGPVARLILSANSPLAENLGFFNHELSQVYVPAPPAGYLGRRPLGAACTWSAPQGVARFGAGCGASPQRFLIDDPVARVTFYRQRILARDPRLGTLLQVNGAPHLRSVVILPCPTRYVITDQSGGSIALQKRTPCRGALDGSFWLDRNATFAVTFHGGAGDHVAALGNSTWSLPAGRDTTIRIPLPAGAHQVSLDLDWANSAGAPTVRAARLVMPDRSDNVL
jgi:hypothetical protein